MLHMRGKMRIHIMAIAAITAMVTLMYVLFGPTTPKTQETVFAGNNYVQISSATWGMNCNPNINHAIERARIERAQLPPEKRDSIPIPKHITRNNALTYISTLCNGKAICAFLTEADVIKFDPIYSCFKDLEISYRCYDIDRLRHAKFRQGEMTRLDCSNVK